MMALSDEVCPTKNQIHVLHHTHWEYQNITQWEFHYIGTVEKDLLWQHPSGLVTCSEALINGSCWAHLLLITSLI